MPSLSTPCALAFGGLPYAFFVGRRGELGREDQFLYCNYYPGGGDWQWEPQDAPGYPGTMLPGVMSTPPHALVPTSHPDHIFVFVGRSDALWVRFWNGDHWAWESTLYPPGIRLFGELLTAIEVPDSDPDPDGSHPMVPSVFAIGTDHAVYQSRRKPAGWTAWTRFPTPAGTQNPPSLNLTSVFFDDPPRPHVFVPRSRLDGGTELRALVGDTIGGFTWSEPLGGDPPDPRGHLAFVSAVSFQVAGEQRIEVFCTGFDLYNLLSCRYNPREGWQWKNHGSSTDVPWHFGPSSAILFQGRPHCFVSSSRNLLCRFMRPGTEDYAWEPLGLPESGETPGNPSATPVVHNRIDQVHVSVVGDSGTHNACWFDGERWHWTALGNPRGLTTREHSDINSVRPLIRREIGMRYRFGRSNN